METKEPYQPTPEELAKAEDMELGSDKALTDQRESELKSLAGESQLPVEEVRSILLTMKRTQEAENRHTYKFGARGHSVVVKKINGEVLEVEVDGISLLGDNVGRFLEKYGPIVDRYERFSGGGISTTERGKAIVDDLLS